jgi:hypothetical protein
LAQNRPLNRHLLNQHFKLLRQRPPKVMPLKAYSI